MESVHRLEAPPPNYSELMPPPHSVLMLLARLLGAHRRVVEQARHSPGQGNAACCLACDLISHCDQVEVAVEALQQPMPRTVARAPAEEVRGPGLWDDVATYAQAEDWTKAYQLILQGVHCSFNKQ